MSEALRRYAKRRARVRFPLLELFAIANSSDDADADDPRRIAERVGLPVATVRSVLSYYADLREEETFTKVCRGTSCVLNGGIELARDLGERAPYGSLYCLGYCDRSPAVLRDRDELSFGREVALRPARSRSSGQPPAPPIRSLVLDPVVTRRVGRGDFSALGRARAEGAYRMLERALSQRPDAILDALERSGVRGREDEGGGTGEAWRRCAEAPGAVRYVVANGDEGDPGSYLDRALLEQDPHGILEGLILCGLAVGAAEGIVFIRSEYPWARRAVERAIHQARGAGILGGSVLGSGFPFEVTLFRGMGSYVCGEETALLNAVEGLRGEVRLRPPQPEVEGLFGRPTVVTNVETLVAVPAILERGPEAYAALGTESSPGTKALSLNRGFEHPGIVEVELGTPLREVIEGVGGGGRGGRELEAVVLGGPMGSVAFADEWDVPICREGMAARGFRLGHGGLVAVPAGIDWRVVLGNWLEFMQAESCGKCLPCSLGSRLALELATLAPTQGIRGRLEDLLGVIESASLCAFGQRIPVPLRRILERCGERVFGPEPTG